MHNITSLLSGVIFGQLVVSRTLHTALLPSFLCWKVTNFISPEASHSLGQVHHQQGPTAVSFFQIIYFCIFFIYSDLFVNVNINKDGMWWHASSDRKTQCKQTAWLSWQKIIKLQDFVFVEYNILSGLVHIWPTINAFGKYSKSRAIHLPPPPLSNDRIRTAYFGPTPCRTAIFSRILVKITGLSNDRPPVGPHFLVWPLVGPRR